ISRSMAQGSHQPFTTLSGIPTNASWAFDNQHFVYQVAGQGVQTDLDSWYQYDSTTGQEIGGTVWPFQPTLTTSQLAQFEVGSDESGKIGFIQVSSNSRYIVYPSSHTNSAGYTLIGMGDLQTGEHKIFDDIFIIGFSSFTAFYGVTWSLNSTAFIIMTASN